MSFFLGFADKLLAARDATTRQTAKTDSLVVSNPQKISEAHRPSLSRTPSKQPDTQGKLAGSVSLPTQNKNSNHHKLSAAHPAPWPSLIPDNIDMNDVLPEFDASNILNSLKSSLAQGTIKNYESVIRTYIDFADSNKIPREKAFPADEKVICAFLASMYLKKSGSTASGALSSLKTWHEFHNMPWHGGRRQQLILKGIAVAAPKESHREKRTPVTIELMQLLAKNLDTNQNIDAAIWAGACTLFWGQSRGGEFFGTSRRKHRSDLHPSRGSITWSEDQSHLSIHLPSTKTNRIAGQTVLIFRQADPLDPLKAIKNHLKVNQGLEKSDHIFAFRQDDSTVRCLTLETFLNKCNEIWTKFGHSRITGHSFRIGGTSTMLQNGVAPDIVKETGRWTSDAFLRYWRDLPTIASNHVSMINLSKNANPVLQRTNSTVSVSLAHLQGAIRPSSQARHGRISGAANRSQLSGPCPYPSPTRL